MLSRLIARQILDHLLSLRYAVLASVGVLFVGWTLFDGAAYHLDRLGEYQVGRETMEDRFQQIVSAPASSFPALDSLSNFPHNSPNQALQGASVRGKG